MRRSNYVAGYDPTSPFDYPNADSTEYRPPSQSTHSLRRILQPHQNTPHPTNAGLKPLPDPPVRRTRRPGNRIMSNLDQFMRREQHPDRRAKAPNRARQTSLLNSRTHSEAPSAPPSPRRPRPASIDLNGPSVNRHHSHHNSSSNLRSLRRSADAMLAPRTQSQELHHTPSRELRSDAPQQASHPPQTSQPLQASQAPRVLQTSQIPQAPQQPQPTQPPQPPQVPQQPQPLQPAQNLRGQLAPRAQHAPSAPGDPIPAHPTPSQSPARTSRRERMRPPPLVTPTTGGGFASGLPTSAVANNNVAPLRPTRRSAVPQPVVPPAPQPLPPPAPEPKPEQPEADDCHEPKAYPKGNDMWINDREDLPLQANGRADEYLFEAASQSSFGDMETPSRIAARNGILPIDSRADPPMVTEDDFRFGPDESFSDGGFIIWRNGRLQAPEKVMRKNSEGLAVEGVPPSSNNLIIVRSLEEFKKSHVFKNSPSRQGGATLGRGAAGKVYLAVHEPSGRKIAVKEINFYDVEKRNQLKKELVTLISHQSRFLVRSFGAFYDGQGRVHVTLEYMDCGSLSDIVSVYGPIPEAVICKIAEHCLRGLCFLHHNHILHRDVKTGNILLSRKLCRAKLSDFGLARDLKEGNSKKAPSDQKSSTDTFVGTPAYMSPERLTGGEYTYASDVWALGISVLECALGRCPFDGLESYFDIIDAAESSPAALVQGKVSSELYKFIVAATERDPQKRPTVRALLDHEFIQRGQSDGNALRDWLDSLPKLHREKFGDLGLPISKMERKARTAKIRAKAEETDL